MRRRLFWSIFGVAGASLVLVAVASAWALNVARIRATRVELDRAGEVVAELVASRLDGVGVDGVLRAVRDPEVLAETQAVRRTVGGSDLVLFVITRDGRVLARPIVQELGIDLSPLTSGSTINTVVRTQRGRLIVHLRPVARLDDSATLGLLLARPAPVELRVPAVVIVGGLGVIALAAAAAAWVLSRWITGRLSAVAEAARAIAEGGREVRVEVRGEDELADLAATFNLMASRLEEARERERQFLLSVGHDLRTPLTTIAGYAEALQEAPDPEQVERIGTILEVESRRLGRLIEDLALLARLEASEFTLRREPVDVTAHVAEATESFRDRAEEAGLRFEVDLEDVGHRVVDPDRLGQILANLVENALRYTPEGGRVTVRLEGDDRSFRIRVSDTGPGVDPEDLPHIFERFYVARRYRGVRPEGSGLGLSIVKLLVEAMGGRVWAESGGGTTITAELPVPVVPPPPLAS